MAGWLTAMLTAAVVMIGLWALLVVLAARLPPGLLKDLAGFLPACVTLVRRLQADPRVPWQARAAMVLAGRAPAAGRLIGAPSPHPAAPEAQGDEPGRT